MLMEISSHPEALRCMPTPPWIVVWLVCILEEPVILQVSMQQDSQLSVHLPSADLTREHLITFSFQVRLIEKERIYPTLQT